MTKNKAEFFDFGSCKNPALSDNKTGLLVFRGLFYQFIGHLIVHIRLAPLVRGTGTWGMRDKFTIPGYGCLFSWHFLAIFLMVS